MDLKTGKNKRKKIAKKMAKKIDSSRQCITCNHTCSMSGLCMKPWPEFDIPKERGGKK